MLLLLGITLTRNDLVIRLILSTDKTIDVHDFFFIVILFSTVYRFALNFNLLYKLMA